LWLMDVIVFALEAAARIGRCNASESMLALDPATGRYDADATPSMAVF
jgi:hypothetical protein